MIGPYGRAATREGLSRRGMLERLDQFMARANALYYAARDPFADFTTAPEISQVFGEILGLWAAVVWDAFGRPTPVSLVEAGPGRGTLMADALRAIRTRAPEFAAAASVHLIETSPRLRTLQAQAVPGAVWHDRLEQLPPCPIMLLANEFLDALPIRQFVQRGASWFERFAADGALVEQPAEPIETVLNASARLEATDEPRVIEVNEVALGFVAEAARHIRTHGGAALFIDYGPAEPASGDSLQAVRGGRFTDALSGPGSADLTAHVDFPALAAEAARHGVVVRGPIPQGVFLTRLGLFQRTDRLARGQPPARASALIEATKRLVEPDQMGRLFKAFALCHPNLVLPGFEE